MEETAQKPTIAENEQNVSGSGAESGAGGQETREKTDGARVRPKFFFAEDDVIPIRVTAFYNPETGCFEFCVPGEIAESGDDFLRAVHEFGFSRIPYDRLNLYRMQSTVYNTEDRTNSVNLIRLRNFFWMYHLRSWNYTDENDGPIPLRRDPGGALSDASLKLLYTIPAAILDTVMGMLEKHLNIS